MEQHTDKQAGFGVAGILTIIGLVAFIGFGGWYIWQSQTKNTQKTTASQIDSTAKDKQQTAKQNVFKIPELGVEFEVKGGIKVLNNYQVDDTLNVPRRYIRGFSTQELVDQGVLEAKGEVNRCTHTSNPYTTFNLTDIFIYSSVGDALASDKNDGGNLKEADITPKHGYFTISNKVFYIQQEPYEGKADSNKVCTKTLEGNKLESQQWQLLHDSLMTLRAIE